MRARQTGGRRCAIVEGGRGSTAPRGTTRAPSLAMLMPPVSRYMSPRPYTIDRGATLASAHVAMREHGVRHLPVVDGGDLCGIVSDRDLHFFEAVAHLPAGTRVEDVMTERPCVVTGDTPLDEVAAIMGEHKYGSVVVVGRDGIEGIFTAVDACRALAEILRREAE
jgi:acetoin utilization protein AcuB